MNILISSCLLGLCCRYDQKSVRNEKIVQLAEKHTLIPVCPEQLGGLPTPRIPCERQGERVMGKDGSDKTEPYLLGARSALQIAHETHCELAILKSRSPSCGKGIIYDGTFSGTLTEGNGVAAELLTQNGIKVLSDEDPEVDKLLSE